MAWRDEARVRSSAPVLCGARPVPGGPRRDPGPGGRPRRAAGGRSPDELGLYEWDGRTIKAHRADVRRYFGFRECSAADADKGAAEWLAANVCEKERQAGRVREELLAHLKGERIIGTALRQAEQALTARIASRVPAEAVARMLALIARAADPGDTANLRESAAT